MTPGKKQSLIKETMSAAVCRREPLCPWDDIRVPDIGKHFSQHLVRLGRVWVMCVLWYTVYSCVFMHIFRRTTVRTISSTLTRWPGTLFGKERWLYLLSPYSEPRGDDDAFETFFCCHAVNRPKSGTNWSDALDTTSDGIWCMAIIRNNLFFQEYLQKTAAPHHAECIWY